MPKISVSNAITPAMARAGLVCFQPFVWRKWVPFATAAWLADMNEWNALGAVPMLSIEGFLFVILNFSEVMDFVARHMAAVLGTALGVTIIAFGVYLAARYVSSRGQFMLLEAVVRNVSVPRESWRRHRELGNNLFKFRIYFDLVIFNVFLVVLIIAGVMAWQDVAPMLKGQDFLATWWSYGAILVTLLSFVIFGILAALAVLMLHALVIPVMYLRQMKAWPAFKHVLRELLLKEKKATLLYLLMFFLAQWIRGMAASMGMMAVMVVTLGLGMILAVLPVLAVVPLWGATFVALPVSVFERAYSLYFLQQFGPQYQPPWEATLPGGFPIVMEKSTVPSVA